jgi:hypothetical protein
MTFSRVAVRDRAVGFMDAIKDIKESNVEAAEKVIYALLESKKDAIKYRAATFLLKTLGGYTERKHLDITTDGKPISHEKPTYIVQIEGEGELKGF